MELVTQRIKLGGNGPIMANALASAGVEVNYLGALGYLETSPGVSTTAGSGQECLHRGRAGSYRCLRISGW